MKNVLRKNLSQLNPSWLLVSLTIVVLLLLSACSPTPDEPVASGVQCDEDNGGLILPDGFCALVVADHISLLRHISVARNGDIFGSRLNRRLGLGGLVAIRDNDDDGKADVIQEFGDQPGLGIAVNEGYVYFGSDTQILRYTLSPDSLTPTDPPEVIVDNFPEQDRHAGKAFALDGMGQMYINVGSASNACQKDELIPESPGIDPCPELETQAAIWRFNEKLVDQSFPNDGVKYATGVRNAYALAWNFTDQTLYAVQHGRDGLFELWPSLYEEQQGAELPAEELLVIKENSVFGWPYCYFDPIKDSIMLSPEYGGDGNHVGRCAGYSAPALAFPAHYGPNDMVFYHADQFHEQYKDGAFIAFHGSYNRGPFEQVGYQVVFVPFKEGLPTGNYLVFADGFSGHAPISAPEDADHRPVGLAVGPDGSLYISDSVQGKIWRVMYQPEATE